MKKAVCLLLAAILALLCCGCNIRGNTTVLDRYSPQALYNTYCAIQDGKLKISVNRTETIPSLTTSIVDSSTLVQNRASLYIYNNKQSTYYVSIHGYAWITDSIDPEKNAHKAIYFNNETQVANSTYEIRVDPDRNTYLTYELTDDTSHRPFKESIYFIFFRHEETEYAAAVTENGIVFWPLEQTVKD